MVVVVPRRMATDSAAEAEQAPGPDGWPLIRNTRPFTADRLGFVEP